MKIDIVNDLKYFYKTCKYSLVDWKNDTCWTNTHKNSTKEDWQNNWKFLTPSQVLKYKCGICYDTANLNDFYLTKWDIPHKNLFACSEEDYLNHNLLNPTHTFTIYLDKEDEKWKWLEGSWKLFKNNSLSSSSPYQLINIILKTLENDMNKIVIGSEFDSFPEYGRNLDEFSKWALTLSYSFKQNPDKK